MATKLDVYRSAVDFAHETLNVTSGKDRMAQAVARFEKDNFEHAEWDWWLQTVENQRNLMGNLRNQKATLAPAPAPAETPAVTETPIATGT